MKGHLAVLVAGLALVLAAAASAAAAARAQLLSSDYRTQAWESNMPHWGLN